jgi:uncharacterized delta-60 repeat protein
MVAGAWPSTTITLRHAPLSQGRKTAVLHVASNLTDGKNPYDLTLKTMPGLVDPTFTPDMAIPDALAMRADGRILAGGGAFIASFNADGTPDNTFFPPALPPGQVSSIAVQKDGRILIGGHFDRVNGRPRTGIARLEADGSLDESFVPPVFFDNVSTVECVVLQPDGRILAGGNFTGVNGLEYPGLVRLNANGSLDAAFNPRPDPYVKSVVVQPDGRILVGGLFSRVNSRSAYRLARLHPDGSLDNSLTDMAVTSDVSRLALLPDGRILVGARSPFGLRRLFPNGVVDPSFHVEFDFSDYSGLAVQADGKCLVTSWHVTVDGITRDGIARISTDGSLDADFNAPGPDLAGFPNPLRFYRMALQADGTVLVAQGDPFPEGALPGHLLRFGNDPAPESLKVEDASTLRWRRGGTAPEVSDVTFDLKTPDSPNWIPLGHGTRIAGGWELSGLTLPAAGSTRAHGHAGGSLIESVAPLHTALESWRLQYFGTAANTGDAADDADSDHDGLVNLVEFAFGLSPVLRGAGLPPPFFHDGTSFTASFASPAGRESILYSAEWSPSLAPGTWMAIPDSGVGGMLRFTVPGTGPRVFVRYVVKIQ